LIDYLIDSVRQSSHTNHNAGYIIVSLPRDNYQIRSELKPEEMRETEIEYLESNLQSLKLGPTTITWTTWLKRQNFWTRLYSRWPQIQHLRSPIYN